ncbi:type VI secretion protein VasK, partial [Cronobacter sakazakii]|nr:type VI secretion protein VasK [Cronobacter sakazakii]
MKIPGNYPGRLGLAGLTITGLFFLGWLIRTFGPACGINTPKEQFFSFLLIVLIMIFVRFLPVFHRAVQERQYRRKAQQTQVLPVDEKRLAPRVALDVIVREIRDRMRHHYGCFWPRKIRILL